MHLRAGGHGWLPPLETWSFVDEAARAADKAGDKKLFQKRAGRSKQEARRVRAVPVRESFHGFKIRADRLYRYESLSWLLRDVSASVDVDPATRSGVTRVVSGAAIGTAFAPGLGTALGALMGASLRKDASRRFLTLSTPAASYVVRFDSHEEVEVRRFAATINNG
ncbi:hypothetical protein [Curtobacterium sp. RRHDQ10]|uniref:hypothetical protein n=1 Tax=Curtobacterium phyllosphaerae TaxID=3413379 RepID=UPI003BF27000